MIFLILLLLLHPQPGESAIFTILSTIFGFAMKTYETLNGLHDTYNKFKPQTSLDDVLDSVKDISKGIDSLQKRLERKIERAVEILIESIPHMQKINDAMKELSDYMIEIDNLFDTFQEFVNETNVNNETIVRISKRITGFASTDVQSRLEIINQLIKPKRTVALRQGLLDLLAGTVKNTNIEVCGTGMGKSSLLLNIFNLLMTTEIRAWIMTSFAYCMLEEFGGESGYLTELNIVKKKMLRRTHEYSQIFGEKGAVPSVDIRRCDEVESTYKFRGLKLYRFRETYVINERSIFDPPICNISCDKYPEPLYQHECLERDGCSESIKCHGELINCKRGPVTDAYIVLSGSPSVKYINAYTYIGNDWQGYVAPWDKVIGVSSRKDVNNNDCHTCVCECINDGAESKAVRRISFLPQISDIQKNHVVTGIVFVLRDFMIYPVIYQGQVRAEGYVNGDTPVEWKDFTVRESHTDDIEENGTLTYWKEENGEISKLIEGRDFGIFKMNQDIINLDTIIVPKDYVVTDSVRFNYPKGNDEFKPIQLELHATPYDFLTGKLIISDEFPSIWVTPDDMKGVLKEYDRPRQEVTLDQPIKLPESIEGILSLNSEPNSFIRFQITSDEKDAGQTVVPYFDGGVNKVVPPYALNGIGLEHKSVGLGAPGFITIKLRMLNPLEYLQFDE